jgi:hypothetical protein
VICWLLLCCLVDVDLPELVIGSLLQHVWRTWRLLSCDL